MWILRATIESALNGCKLPSSVLVQWNLSWSCPHQCFYDLSKETTSPTFLWPRGGCVPWFCILTSSILHVVGMSKLPSFPGLARPGIVCGSHDVPTFSILHVVGMNGWRLSSQPLGRRCSPTLPPGRLFLRPLKERQCELPGTFKVLNLMQGGSPWNWPIYPGCLISWWWAYRANSKFLLWTLILIVHFWLVPTFPEPLRSAFLHHQLVPRKLLCLSWCLYEQFLHPCFMHCDISLGRFDAPIFPYQHPAVSG